MSKNFCFRHFQVFTRCRSQNVSVGVPFSKSTVFKICRQKMCRFRVNGRPIRHIFHRFQNVPASCERSLRNYDGFTIFSTIFLAFSKKKRNTAILKILKISEKSNGRIIAKLEKFLRSHSVKRNRSQNFTPTFLKVLNLCSLFSNITRFLNSKFQNIKN